MPKPPDNTLKLALDALVQIENGFLPTVEQLKALQLSMWAWMDGADATSTTELLKQGSALSRKASALNEANTLAVKVYEYKEQHNVSTSKALQNVDSAASERTRWNKLKYSKLSNPKRAKRFMDIKTTVEKALQKKP